MAVVEPDYSSAPRGNTDAARHRRKVKEALRENLPDIVADEAIITRKGDRVVKVPIRGVKSYHFVHGRPGGGGGGFGTGEGQKGKVIGRRPKPDSGQPGRPGGEPGMDYFETEVDIEEIIEMMLQDLGLPNLKQKEIRETIIPKGWTFDTIRTSGVHSRLDKLRSAREAIKRTEQLVAYLMEATEKPEDECRRALTAAGGDVERAEETLTSAPDETAAGNGKAPAPEHARAPGAGNAPGAHPADRTAEAGSEDEAEPDFTLDSDDLRYRTLTEDIEYQSNAVVLAMMDVSGSMDTMKKYLARSFFFWMLSFLRSIYRHVDIRFIAHTTEAKLVDEQAFFHRGESGGTVCASAYELAGELIDTDYPTSRWNVYPFHFSDGEDWDPEKTVAAAKALLGRHVAALGYGEIRTEYSASVLMNAFEEGLSLIHQDASGYEYFEGTSGLSPVIGVIVRTKEDLYPALRAFLRPEIGRELGAAR